MYQVRYQQDHWSSGFNFQRQLHMKNDIWALGRNGAPTNNQTKQPILVSYDQTRMLS